MSKGRVAVALSGGVDSSVAALLLKIAGYEVLGIYIHLSDSPHSEYQAYHAEHVCRTLNIPFQIMDLRKEFECYVVDYFCQEYHYGRTPNPCIACNQYIKFGVLLNKVLSLDIGYLATGHYARIGQSSDCKLEELGVNRVIDLNSTNSVKRGYSEGNEAISFRDKPRSCEYHLLKGVDANKDQSYFLYTLSQEKLSHILFPLGDYSKDVVQKLAKQEGLPTVSKSSQDICFVSEENYHAFLRERLCQIPGDVMDIHGKILGRHKGIAFYTIGQRHGLGLAIGKPLYVLRIEPEHNCIILGEKNELYSQEVIAKNLSWVSGMAPSDRISVNAKIRYKSKEATATVLVEGDSVLVSFSQQQQAVTPGQAIVFYKEKEVLGGGIMENKKQNAKADI
ncbi:MAG: tRNA 2-thiouridine(34) synthase MnmA [Chloroflexota bacterium]|nr:tRNA 2-thiouridine(34) synthase MnmA [Chloroflexota bacterium]